MRGCSAYTTARIVSRQTTPAMCGAIIALALPLVAEATSSPVIVGDTRVSALSPTLLRIEAKGPQGFENRQTFNVIGREEFGGIEIEVLNKSSSGTWLAAPTYHVFVPAPESPPPPGPAGSCDPQSFQENTDCAGPRRTGNYPNGAATSSPEACCALCSSDPECVAWTFHGGDGDGHCWPFSSCPGTRVNPGRTFAGATARGPSSFGTSAIVTTPSGKVLWNGTNTGNSSKVAPNLLHWPSPLESASYAFMDSPRFTVPPWGPTPMPNVSTGLAPGRSVTNGYDFTNDKAGDIYVFIIGDSIEDWWASRAEFLRLTGPSPLLPDFTYGVWYTWYRQYSESQAKDEIGNWTKINLPLDSWGLDMNWRNVGFGEGAAPGDSASVMACHNQTNDDPRCRDHFYTHPNVEQLPGLGTSNEWFDYLKQQKLRTYFNDHPFPVDNQTTPKECAFRYAGLQEWIGRGLSYWWFDHNWAFTLPGPRMPWDTKDSYEGMSGQVWGSHIYYESTKKAYEQHGITDRPIALSRDNGPNWKAPDPEGQCLHGAGSPAHHRFPVWWTGDGVPLMGSVGSMVEEAVHDMRAFVHSDCGGHGLCKTTAPKVKGRPPPPPEENEPCVSPTDATLLRWTAHCVFGTVVRFHQGDHRFWLRSETVQETGRSYLDMRYKLAPSLVAAGRLVQKAGFPLTARCDLIWPHHPESKDPSQYLHLNATLVAPLEAEPAGQNWKNATGKPAPLPTNRTVWIPPGEWQDAWSGATLSGPKTINVEPKESAGVFQIPLWHKRGGLLVAAQEGKLRIGDQNWAELTMEGFPASVPSSERREIYEQDFSAYNDNISTTVELGTGVDGKIWVSVSASDAPRSWLVRLHLRRGQLLQLDESEEEVALRHIHPPTDCAAQDFFPFGGAGTAPACDAGAVAEFQMKVPPEGRRIEATLQYM